MMSTHVSRCDCCSLAIGAEMGDECPRCGYPITVAKEKLFLELALQDLKRVADYGGAGMTVGQLFLRYQTRLHQLLLSQLAPVVQETLSAETAQRAPHPMVMPSALSTKDAPLQPSTAQSPIQPVAPVPPMVAPIATIQVQQSVQGRQQSPTSVFSLRSFLADQTINIVASLGAFLILIGSLSFVATTANLLLSFLVMFAVHAAFGVTGIVTYRFHSFRIVAAIYTAIFALLIPLVGFSAYRLVMGNFVALTPPTLIAIAAAYATIAYAALAIYQRFSPFGYFSVIALVTADLATATAFHLGYWWWPSTLMLLALPALTALPRSPDNATFFSGYWSLLREPVCLLMYTCVTVCSLGVVSTFFYSIQSDASAQTSHEARFALVCVLLLLLCWLILCVWRTRIVQRAVFAPYLFLSLVLACCYTFEVRAVGYVVVLPAVALLFHGITRLAAPWLRAIGSLALHMERLALVLVALVPFVAIPLLPYQLLEQAYMPGSMSFRPTGDTIVDIIALVAGLTLTISVVLSHTGLRKTPDTTQKSWPWLLLLSGFLLNCAYSLLMLSLKGVPTWWFLVFTLVFMVSAVVVRRLVSAAWANPLDVLTLCLAAETLLLSVDLNPNRIIALSLFFAILSYCIVFYQKRSNWLFLSFVFSVLALAPLFQRPLVLLIASVLLPLIAVVIRRFTNAQWRIADMTHREGKIQALTRPLLSWEWPLTFTALLYGVSISLHDFMAGTTTIQNLFSIAFPVSLELASLAFVWYLSAALVRIKWWLVPAVSFAAAALLLPQNNFWVLAWLAPLLAVGAFVSNRLASRIWALPLYVLSILAAVMMDVAAYSQGVVPAATWALMIFALLIYLLGVAENEPLWMWTAPFIALWSVYAFVQLGDLYYPPLLVLLGTAIGVGIGCLRFLIPSLAISPQKHNLLRFALPFYTVAIGAAILTGLPISPAWSTNLPFYAAVPVALLFYALLAYGVSLFERRPAGQWLVAGFAIWAILLMPETISCQLFAMPGRAIDLLCTVPKQNTLYVLAAIALVTGLIGVCAGRLIRNDMHSVASWAELRAKFAWNGVWYVSSLLAIVTTLGWGYSVRAFLPDGLVLIVLTAFIALTLLIMLLERAPELLVVPVALALWSISQVAWIIPQLHWMFWQQAIACSVLCILIFASQFVWRFLPSATSFLPPAHLHQALSLGIQMLVVLAAIALGGLSAASGLLAHVGAGTLAVLTALFFCTGRLQANAVSRRLSIYISGLLLSLVISWEVSALGYTHVDWLTLAPATYGVVVAPFLSRDENLLQRHRISQICSIIGASLLLLPTLWLSFGNSNLQPTLFLASESLALLVLGVATRVRIFVLSGAALVVVGAMHALFLPSLGIPSSLALAILGATLLAIATGLSLLRHRLQLAWTNWE